MANIGLIPARGGSKRIPKKNTRDFLGKPIIAYTIDAAQKSGCFDNIIVSTDCPEIREVALSFGAEVPFIRPDGISDDHATTNDVIKHALDWASSHNMNCDYLCCMYATAPFIAPSYIADGLSLLTSHPNASYAISVTSFPFPIQRAVRIENGRLHMFNPEHLQTRSQDLEEAFHDAGQFYWGRPKAFLENVAFFSEATLPVPIPRYMVQDIDTEEDWVRAELLYKSHLLGSGQAGND